MAFEFRKLENKWLDHLAKQKKLLKIKEDSI
jgi:hypothetical protein